MHGQHNITIYLKVTSMKNLVESKQVHIRSHTSSHITKKKVPPPPVALDSCRVAVRVS
jgi:hypothetical protein